MKLDLASSNQLEKVEKDVIYKFEFLAKKIDKLKQRVIDLEARLEE